MIVNTEQHKKVNSQENIRHVSCNLLGKISIVLNTNWYEPVSDDEKDLEAAERNIQFSVYSSKVI
jgi:beta-glucosidase/6-phospho-beta-glucosidase/beta-galactosidase